MGTEPANSAMIEREKRQLEKLERKQQAEIQ
jgi:hypothetical protein